MKHNIISPMEKNKKQRSNLSSVMCVVAGMVAISACSQQQDAPAAKPNAAETSTEAKTEAKPAVAPAYPGIEHKPVFNRAGELLQPEGFRRWIFIGTPLTPNGLNNGAAGFPEYHNVYVQRNAFDHYRATGEWLEGTMLVKELQLAKSDDTNFEDGSRVEPSGRGYFPHAVNGMDIAVKDSKRFADTNNWGYFNFGHHAPPYEASAAAAPKEACAQCHIDNADEDMVYVSFYKSILDPLPGN